MQTRVNVQFIDEDGNKTPHNVNFAINQQLTVNYLASELLQWLHLQYDLMHDTCMTPGYSPVSYENNYDLAQFLHLIMVEIAREVEPDVMACATYLEQPEKIADKIGAQLINIERTCYSTGKNYCTLQWQYPYTLHAFERFDYEIDNWINWWNEYFSMLKHYIKRNMETQHRKTIPQINEKELLTFLAQ